MHNNSLSTTPIIPVTSKTLAAFMESASSMAQQWVKHHRFHAKPRTALCVPNLEGDTAYILAGVEETPNIWSLAHVADMAPKGEYHIQSDWDEKTLGNVSLGLLLAQYRFSRYSKQPSVKITLKMPKGIDLAEVQRLASAIYFTRDLINTPPNHMHPESLAKEAKALADQCHASFHEIIGEDLLDENYPAIHAVGRASAVEPRLIEIRHGNAAHPQVTLVGKGVTFDTGGLDIKPYNTMKLMKKDMGGAALVLGLAKALMEANLPIRLRVLIPAVENSIDAHAFRPQDILDTRKGITVETGSTDAEGRLILCDALYEADQERPDLLIDVATLTGAARVALGTDLPALFANQQSTATKLQEMSHALHDPLWQLPLWEGYDEYIDETIADIGNTPHYGFAGAITAALFLQRFISPETDWVHIDSYAWNNSNRPGRPQGGEALAMRALYYYIKARYSNTPN